MELSAFAGKFGRYVRSPSTRMAAFAGLLDILELCVRAWQLG